MPAKVSNSAQFSGLLGGIELTLLAQPPSRIFCHADAYRSSPEEIGSEQSPEANHPVPRQRTRLEERHRSERDKADARENRPTRYPAWETWRVNASSY